MSLTQFRALIDSYGSDLTRWPPDQRTAAEDLLRRSAEARTLLSTAREVDRALSEREPPLTEERRSALVDRILSRLDESGT